MLPFDVRLHLARRTLLLHGWLLGVAVASVGLSLLYLTAWSHGLNTGLPFTPVSDIAGGLLIGTGMAVGRGTCLGPGRTMRECVPFPSGAT